MALYKRRLPRIFQESTKLRRLSMSIVDVLNTLSSYPEFVRFSELPNDTYTVMRIHRVDCSPKIGNVFTSVRMCARKANQEEIVTFLPAKIGNGITDEQLDTMRGLKFTKEGANIVWSK